MATDSQKIPVTLNMTTFDVSRPQSCTDANKSISNR